MNEETTTTRAEPTPNQQMLRNEASHRVPRPEDIEKLRKLRQASLDLAVAIDELCPPGRGKAVALTKVDEARMWGCNSIVQSGVILETLEINLPKQTPWEKRNNPTQ